LIAFSTVIESCPLGATAGLPVVSVLSGELLRLRP
jgi:hypothetical protein